MRAVNWTLLCVNIGVAVSFAFAGNVLFLAVHSFLVGWISVNLLWLYGICGLPKEAHEARD